MPLLCDMFERKLIDELTEWAGKPNRKPLVLRGARQVGKTTIVEQFAARFDEYLYLNLELPQNQEPFKRFTNLENLVQALFFLKNVSRKEGRTLIFIDEIQEVPEAFWQLRYFYEQAPQYHVIAAGSLLETLFDSEKSFPVGRVDYKVVRPASFPEFLKATGEEAAFQQLESVPIAEFAHDKLLSLFHTYTLIGGMPEVVSHYAQYRDLAALKPIYDSLLASYLEDVEKYARTTAQVAVIRHAIRSAFYQAGKRISFANFGKSGYGSREMGEALRALEQAMLLHLVYPTVNTQPPALPDYRKSPRLQVLDTGLMNAFTGLQPQVLTATDLNQIYHGTIAEHVVGQELLNLQSGALSRLDFWVREKKSSSAETDFLWPYETHLIPVEVKSGAAGKLRSLHQFMEQAPHGLAVRFYAGKFRTDNVKTPEEKHFRLISLPYYLTSKIEAYLAQV
ncbi:MAG: AAA family ATPase [Bacteroidia bacterium]